MCVVILFYLQRGIKMGVLEMSRCHKVFYTYADFVPNRKVNRK